MCLIVLLYRVTDLERTIYNLEMKRYNGKTIKFLKDINVQRQPKAVVKQLILLIMLRFPLTSLNKFQPKINARHLCSNVTYAMHQYVIESRFR